ncbi:hypothetical protein GGQ22_02940 [Nocardioides sp. zg-579]|uniref:Uncharacterized protein n=1 Tax=Nocardioides marmotae TaxID=2663857 RepID=A0A6I3J7J8_9ACTN|nr:hypothetical protein [Nocardioides marmotae]MCR6030394.1 hypothetical protein [Gordonia jinghuaiqii]MTB94029.1 hypothetical protein [Nocardioides marmotae]QKE00338.1 hypothetical protein HPC71_04020 [Nocardioides marmotae]
MRSTNTLSALPARVGGAVIATAVRGLAAARPAEKPMHPVGRVLRGRLERRGVEPGTGVRFLDEPGIDEVVARESKGIGLPEGLPDIHGLAIKVPLGGASPAEAAEESVEHGRRHADVLLSTNGWGPVSRFLVVPSAGMTTRPLTTLFPYRGPQGAVLLGARYVAEHHVELAVAGLRSGWRVFADLHLESVDPDSAAEDDPALEFDAILNELPGLPNYPWVRRVRAPSYAIARRSRRSSDQQ